MRVILGDDKECVSFGANDPKKGRSGYHSGDWFNIYQGTAFAVGKKVYIMNKGWLTEKGFE